VQAKRTRVLATQSRNQIPSDINNVTLRDMVLSVVTSGRSTIDDIIDAIDII